MSKFDTWLRKQHIPPQSYEAYCAKLAWNAAVEASMQEVRDTYGAESIVRDIVILQIVKLASMLDEIQE